MVCIERVCSRVIRVLTECNKGIENVCTRVVIGCVKGLLEY